MGNMCTKSQVCIIFVWSRGRGLCTNKHLTGKYPSKYRDPYRLLRASRGLKNRFEIWSGEFVYKISGLYCCWFGQGVNHTYTDTRPNIKNTPPASRIFDNFKIKIHGSSENCRIFMTWLKLFKQSINFSKSLYQLSTVRLNKGS